MEKNRIETPSMKKISVAIAQGAETNPNAPTIVGKLKLVNYQRCVKTRGK